MNANVTAAAVSRRSPRNWYIALLVGLALLALWFVVKRAFPYLGLDPDLYGPYFWPRRWELVLHVAGGSVALLTGLVQLWLGLTNRTGRPHRALGRVYVGAIAIGSLAGFCLALTIRGNPPYGSGLFFLCVAWVITTAMAVFAIRRRDVARHREWMVRSYAVPFAFVTFRIGVDALIARGMAPADAQGIMAWACWAVPLLVLEPAIDRWRAANPRPEARPPALSPFARK